jgi:hypothetical protein
MLENDTHSIYDGGFIDRFDCSQSFCHPGVILTNRCDDQVGRVGMFNQTINGAYHRIRVITQPLIRPLSLHTQQKTDKTLLFLIVILFTCLGAFSLNPKSPIKNPKSSEYNGLL